MMSVIKLKEQNAPERTVWLSEFESGNINYTHFPKLSQLCLEFAVNWLCIEIPKPSWYKVKWNLTKGEYSDSHSHIQPSPSCFVSSSFRLPAPRPSPWSSATPWTPTATRRRTPSPAPPHPATTPPPGWIPATAATPQSTSTTSTAASRTVTACRTAGRPSRRASPALSVHRTTAPRTMAGPALPRRAISGGICRWAPTCATTCYDGASRTTDLWL